MSACVASGPGGRAQPRPCNDRCLMTAWLQNAGLLWISANKCATYMLAMISEEGQELALQGIARSGCRAADIASRLRRWTALATSMRTEVFESCSQISVKTSAWAKHRPRFKRPSGKS